MLFIILLGYWYFKCSDCSVRVYQSLATSLPIGAVNIIGTIPLCVMWFSAYQCTKVVPMVLSDFA